MKLSTFFLFPVVVGATALSVASAGTLRATCDDGTPEPTPTPTETPAETTPAPTSTTTPAFLAFFDASGPTAGTWPAPTLDKCVSWSRCELALDTFSGVSWPALGPAGTTIQFFTTRACEGSVYDEFPADAPNAFATSMLSGVRTLIVRSSPDAPMDRSDTSGCPN